MTRGRDPARSRTGGAPPLVGALETGGTTIACAVGTGPADLRATATFPTTAPGETLGRALDFFRDQMRRAPLAAVGIAAFGPLDLDPASATHGSITTTPKPGWARTDLVGVVGNGLGLPVAIDTDVNAAAVGEHRWGAARGLDAVVYITVGTGIGGGALIDGRPLHGLGHPEMGHIRVPHDRDADPFAGACPYHGDCLEGLASALALARRWGRGPEALPAAHPAWVLEARYLALGLISVISILAPRRVVMGGGLVRQPALLPRVRAQVLGLLNGYVPSAAIDARIDDYIVAPALGARAGVLGALALAQDLARGAGAARSQDPH
jgi:fructokinase